MQWNGRILAIVAAISAASLYGCEDTVELIPDFNGGLYKQTTDGVTGKTTTEHFPAPPAPAPTGALKSDAGRG